jgi:hypothetical protein
MAQSPDIASADTLCEAVRGALLELLTIGQYHDAATPATLRAVGATRTALAKLDPRSRHNPVASDAHNLARHVALKNALADTVGALYLLPDTTHLRVGLSTLAAVALAWLDALCDDTPTGGGPDE